MSFNDPFSALNAFKPWFEESEHHSVIGIGLTDVLLRGHMGALTEEQQSALIRIRYELTLSRDNWGYIIFLLHQQLGSLSPPNEPIDLRDTSFSVVNALQPMGIEYRLRLHIPENLPLVRGDQWLYHFFKIVLLFYSEQPSLEHLHITMELQEPTAVTTIIRGPFSEAVVEAADQSKTLLPFSRLEIASALLNQQGSTLHVLQEDGFATLSFSLPLWQGAEADTTTE
jgi:hypothetical protein